MSAETSPHPHGKARTWTLPTILGLILGALGLLGLVELRPQMTVSPQEPLNKSQPFSVPFRISNTGYFSFHVFLVVCYIHEVEFPGTTGPITFSGSTVHQGGWEGGTLERGDSQTVICNLANAIPKKADIAIVIDYAALFIPDVLKSRRYFRFVGAFGDNWQWLPQPSGDIQAQADESVDDFIKRRKAFGPH